MVIVGIVSLLVVAGAVGVALWFRNKQIQLKTAWKISYDDLNFQTDRVGNAIGVRTKKFLFHTQLKLNLNYILTQS